MSVQDNKAIVEKFFELMNEANADKMLSLIHI